jgi:IS30 family transposase
MAKSRGIRAPYRWLNPSERRQIEQRLRAGGSVAAVAVEFGCSVTTVQRARNDLLLARRRVSHSGFRLSFEERVEIALGIARGESDSEIARGLERHRSTVGREIARCGKRWHYRAFAAERKAGKRARRPKAGKLASCPRLLAEVEAGLVQRWSPRQISARLRADHPDDQVMRISPETIYQSLYVQSRGELRRQLTAGLRSGRTKRRSHRGAAARKRQIEGMIPISQRPAEVNDRAVPGHWEGDLILGAGNRSAVATLVERQTRYVLLAYLGNDHTTLTVIAAITKQIRDLPAQLKLSLTWDQGTELSAHRQFTVQSGVSVFFCDPHSPWQRGSNENTNGLLRQYLPKGSDLAAHDQAQLDAIAAELNGRPRETLGFMKPAEKMLELLTSTA